MPKIAIISDLHVGSAARSPDMNPYAPKPVRSDGFLESFQIFARNSHVTADYLLVPGDISDKAHPAEYELATSVIRHVAEILGVENERIFPVLGNHDLNWALVNAIEGAPEFGHELRFAPAMQSAWLNERLTSAGGRSQTGVPYISLDETDDLYLVRYNSAESDLPNVHPHRGAIQQQHLDMLKTILADHPPTGDKIRVFLTHHHPQIYSDPIPDLPDFSALVNAEALLEALREARFDLLVHGHKHSPRFTSSAQAGGHAMSVLCAGSFSREIDTAWTGRITNQFHQVNSEGRDDNTGYLRGHVLSWAYQPRQWRPSDGQWAGIHHRLPFGSYPSEPEIMHQIRQGLTARLNEKTIRWSDVTEAVPGIEFVDAGLVGRALSAFASETDSILRFSSNNPHELALVRR